MHGKKIRVLSVLYLTFSKGHEARENPNLSVSISLLWPGTWSKGTAERHHGSAEDGAGQLWVRMGHRAQMYLFLLLPPSRSTQGEIYKEKDMYTVYSRYNDMWGRLKMCRYIWTIDVREFLAMWLKREGVEKYFIISSTIDISVTVIRRVYCIGNPERGWTQSRPVHWHNESSSQNPM